MQGAGHNDVEMYTQYLERLKQFVSVELINWQQLNSDVSAQDAGSGKSQLPSMISNSFWFICIGVFVCFFYDQ